MIGTGVIDAFVSFLHDRACRFLTHIRLQTVRLMDASLNKMTRINERLNMQLRFEGFNVLNSFFINSRQFNNDPTNANFGSLIKAETSAPNSNYPRQVQIAVKLIW